MFSFGGIQVLSVLAAFSKQTAAMGFEMADQVAHLHAATKEIFSFSENSSGNGVPDRS